MSGERDYNRYGSANYADLRGKDMKRKMAAVLCMALFLTSVTPMTLMAEESNVSSGVGIEEVNEAEVLAGQEVTENKDKLVEFLRTNLNNSQATLKVVVDEKEIKREAYTSAEKYRELLNENPLLEKFTQTLGLQLE